MSGEDPPRHLTLRVGEEREIELPSLGTAGFAWEHEVEGGADAVDVDWRRLPLAGGRPVGESGPGRARVRLFQRRPWERERPPLHEHELQLEVRA
jgi:predicted secreted protein